VPYPVTAAFLFLRESPHNHSNKSQRIGDIVAGTIVIFTRSKSFWQDTFYRSQADYNPLSAVMQMSDKDINSLKMIIDNVKKHNIINWLSVSQKE